jgi:hypothetical protein
MIQGTAKENIIYFKIPEEYHDFMLKREKALAGTVKKHDTYGCLHPKNGLSKKVTSFYKGCCHVRFDRKTLPKSGRSVINDCFVENKYDVYLVWYRPTRALLGIVKRESDLAEKINEWKRRLE